MKLDGARARANGCGRPVRHYGDPFVHAKREHLRPRLAAARLVAMELEGRQIISHGWKGF